MFLFTYLTQAGITNHLGGGGGGAGGPMYNQGGFTSPQQQQQQHAYGVSQYNNMQVRFYKKVTYNILIYIYKARHHNSS